MEGRREAAGVGAASPSALLPPAMRAAKGDVRKATPMAVAPTWEQVKEVGSLRRWGKDGRQEDLGEEDGGGSEVGKGGAGSEEWLGLLGGAGQGLLSTWCPALNRQIRMKG